MNSGLYVTAVVFCDAIRSTATAFVRIVPKRELIAVWINVLNIAECSPVARLNFFQINLIASSSNTCLNTANINARIVCRNKNYNDIISSCFRTADQVDIPVCGQNRLESKALFLGEQILTGVLGNLCCLQLGAVTLTFDLVSIDIIFRQGIL